MLRWGDGGMKVKLIDIDNKYREKCQRGKRFPNLALMKLSAYHKAQGDIVGFDITNPDITHISCVFDKNRDHALKESQDVVGGLTSGGSAISMDYKLPDNIEFIKPDYELYPFQEYSMGFSSRGCDRRCGFCIVHKKEGCFRRHQHIKEFHDFRFKSCKLLDNNILTDPDWFFEQTNWAIDNGVTLDFTQGLDIRYLTKEIAEQIKRTHFVDQQIRFAWDIPPFGATEKQVAAGIDLLKKAGINIRRNVSFYVLVGADWEGEKIVEIPCAVRDLYRPAALRALGAMCFIQKFHNNDATLNHLARWANRRQLYRSCQFSEYLESKRKK